MLLARRAPSLLLRSTGAPLRAVATAPTALSSAAAAAAAASRPAASFFSAAVRGGAAASGSTTAASAATVASGTARALARRFMSSGARGLGAVGAPSQREMEFVTQGRQGGSKPRRNVSGVISINTKWNNTLIDISDTAFNTKATVTAGSCGFKKSKRASVFATEKTVSEAFVKARSVSAAAPPKPTLPLPLEAFPPSLSPPPGPAHHCTCLPPLPPAGHPQGHDQPDGLGDDPAQAADAVAARAEQPAHHEAAAVNGDAARWLPTAQGTTSPDQDEGEADLASSASCTLCVDVHV